MRKESVIKVLSCLLVVWYMLCLIGVNVHTCNASGKSVMSLVVEGLGCDDIHPEHHCSGGPHGCCGGHGSDDGGASFCSRCCSESILLMEVVCADREEEGHSHHHNCGCACGHCPVLSDICTGIFGFPCSGTVMRIPDFSYKGLLSENIQSFYSVWRI